MKYFIFTESTPFLVPPVREDEKTWGEVNLKSEIDGIVKLSLKSFNLTK